MNEELKFEINILGMPSTVIITKKEDKILLKLSSFGMTKEQEFDKGTFKKEMNNILTWLN